MATKQAVFSDAEGDGSVLLVTWALTATDDGSPVQKGAWADRSMQAGIAGDNFNAGTVLIEGSNDGVTWTTLRAPDSTALSFTAAGLKQVLETVAYIRPRASVAVTAVTVIMCARRATPLRT